jgi:hypothetical protein
MKTRMAECVWTIYAGGRLPIGFAQTGGAALPPNGPAALSQNGLGVVLQNLPNPQ